MPEPSEDPSVFDEPHMREGRHAPDPSERDADRTLGRREDSEDDRIEQSVWDEPALSHELSGATPDDALTYERWLLRHRRRFGPARSWLAALGLALAAGPWAVLGALWGSGQTGFGVVNVTVFAPVTEEVMKVALVAYVVEKRPYVFRSGFQLMLCVMAGALSFSAIENLVYLNIYCPDPPAWLVHMRWSVCVLLHVGCSAIVGVGLVKIWSGVWEGMKRPKFSRIYPYLGGAIAIHGAYNAMVIILERSLFRF